MTGDPHHVRVLAARLRMHSELVRALAGRVGDTREVAWRSPAAAAFRHRTQDLVVGLRRVATELDDAGQALDRHAAALEIVADAMAGALAVGEGTVQGVVHDLAAVLP